MAFRRVWHARAVMLMVPTCPESGLSNVGGPGLTAGWQAGDGRGLTAGGRLGADEG